MSDPTTTSATAPGTAELARLIAATVLETPGVIRLEPALRNMLLLQVDGVRLSVTNGAVETAIEVAIDNAHTALPTAELLQQRVIDLIRGQDLSPTDVSVSILAIDHSPQALVPQVTPGR